MKMDFREHGQPETIMFAILHPPMEKMLQFPILEKWISNTSAQSGSSCSNLSG